MDYKTIGTNYDGSPIKQPIWESMAPEERVALRCGGCELLARKVEIWLRFKPMVVSPV